MTDWALRVNDAGHIDLTMGPAPRKTVGLTVDDGRMLADALLRTADMAEGLADAAESKRIAAAVPKKESF